ncbi:MAG: hypothetical protein Q7T55_19275 [Solirubrobacteraceae bacterium]|nr:hypothetical protein [Solirubrobacteraceae bacterium]
MPLADWVAEANFVAAETSDNCGTQGYFYTTLGASQLAVGWRTGLGLTLPDGLKATSLRTKRLARNDASISGDTNASPSYSLRYSSGARWYEAGVQEAESCVLGDGCAVVNWPGFPSTKPPEASYTFPGGTSFVGFSLACIQHGPPNGACQVGTSGRSHLRVDGIDLTVRDDAAPVVAGPAGGTITRAGARSGIETFTLPATDVGAGVYQAILAVDGVEVARVSPDASATCTGGAGLADTDLDFTRLQPCRRAVDVSLSVDTTKYANGPHQLRATLRDAAGNLGAPATLEAAFENRPGPTPAPGTPGGGAPNGTGGDVTSGTLGRKGERTKLIASYGSAPAIVGSLRDAAGKPIAGATIDLSEQLDVPGAAWTSVDSIFTDAAGNYRFKPKTTATRRIRFAYAPAAGSTTYRSQREVLVAVRAKMTIKAASAVVPRRGLISLSGGVKLDGLPEKGAWVEIQWLKGKAWKTIGTRRVDRRGGWVFRHRLTSLTNTAIRFRSRLRPASDVPSEQVSSRGVSVRVR